MKFRLPLLPPPLRAEVSLDFRNVSGTLAVSKVAQRRNARGAFPAARAVKSRGSIETTAAAEGGLVILEEPTGVDVS